MSLLDTLFALKENTTGRPRKIICDLLTPALSNLAQVLSDVWATSCKHFGSNALIQKHLEDHLSSSKPIKNPSQTEEIHNLLRLLQVIKANIPNCSNLKYIQLQKAMEEIWQKLHNSVPPPLDHLLQLIKNYEQGKNNPVFKRSGGIKAKVYLTEARDKLGNKSSATFCGFHQSSCHFIHKYCELYNRPYPDPSLQKNSTCQPTNQQVNNQPTTTSQSMIHQSTNQTKLLPTDLSFLVKYKYLYFYY